MVDACDEHPDLNGFEDLSAMPQWLPGETLFSLASRYHALSGNRLPSTTCKALFGHARQGCQHDFPTRLEEFCTRTRLSDNPRHLALRRTLLPFYLPLRSEAESEAAVQSLAIPRAGVLKFRLGILTSRFRANHPLKACPLCIADDVRSHGVGYWHLEHQLPGVWACRQHGGFLSTSRLKSSGVARFGWVLPTTDHLDRISCSSGQARCNEALAGFANLVCLWASLPAETHLTADRLAHTYSSALGTRTVVQGMRSRSMSAFAADFCAAVAPLRQVPELAALPATPGLATALLDRCVRRPRGGTHPLNHLAIIHWLFPSWDAFLNCYSLTSAPWPATFRLEPLKLHIAPDARKAALSELIAQGRSITSAAGQVGIDTHTAAAWAATTGVVTPRRPKVLKGDAFDDLVAALQSGMDKPDAARMFSVSVQTVTRVLRSVVGLQAAWHATREASAREAARRAWSAAITHRPSVGLKAVRDLAPGAYAWLYRNDREWLRGASKPAECARAVAVSSRVDWDARDRALSADVRRVAAEIAEKLGKPKLALWDIYQVLPELSMRSMNYVLATSEKTA